MDPELEALLKSYDAFLEARGGTEEETLLVAYQSQLQTAAAARRLSTKTLDGAIRKKYPRWVKATARPSTLPPKFKFSEPGFSLWNEPNGTSKRGPHPSAFRTVIDTSGGVSSS